MRGAGLGVVLVPIFSVIGSLLAGVVYALLSPVTLREGLAISAGFGWYTMAPSVISGAGHAVAGAISFLHNVLRETMGHHLPAAHRQQDRLYRGHHAARHMRRPTCACRSSKSYCNPETHGLLVLYGYG